MVTSPARQRLRRTLVRFATAGSSEPPPPDLADAALILPARRVSSPCLFARACGPNGRATWKPSPDGGGTAAKECPTASARSPPPMRTTRRRRRRADVPHLRRKQVPAPFGRGQAPDRPAQGVCPRGERLRFTHPGRLGCQASKPGRSLSFSIHQGNCSIAVVANPYSSVKP